MNGNNEGGSVSARLKHALHTAAEGLRGAGTEVGEVARDAVSETIQQATTAVSTLRSELAEGCGKLHERLAIEQGETPEVAARIKAHVKRNFFTLRPEKSTPNTGGPSGPGPGAGDVF